jgi:deazaflavin-dependent oxidoreductase (nitroreductase family)
LRSGLKAQVHAVMAKEGVLPRVVDMFGPAGRRPLDAMVLGESYTIRVESLRDLIEVYDREIVMLGYLEDGPNLVALAMNGWDEGSPAWWLNLEAHPDAVIRLADKQPRSVHARVAAGDERKRLWQRWVAVDPRIGAFAGRRSTETPVIVLEPRNQAA